MKPRHPTEKEAAGVMDKLTHARDLENQAAIALQEAQLEIAKLRLVTGVGAGVAYDADAGKWGQRGADGTISHLDLEG